MYYNDKTKEEWNDTKRWRESNIIKSRLLMSTGKMGTCCEGHAALRERDLACCLLPQLWRGARGQVLRPPDERPGC